MFATLILVGIVCFAFLSLLAAHGDLHKRHAQLQQKIAGLTNSYSGFAILQHQVGQWSRYNFPHNKPYYPLFGACEEIGELCHAQLKSDQGIRGTKEEHHAAKKDAVADAVIYLADYCERNDIDFADAVQTTWDQVRQRDWRKYPKNGRTE